MSKKVYQFNEYVLGYYEGENDRSCLVISKYLLDKVYVMAELYDGSAKIISTILDSLQKENKQLQRENKKLKKDYDKALKRYIAFENYYYILKELEEWVKNDTLDFITTFYMGRAVNYKFILDKIQKLKEKYK